jgi:hypothetical protein
MGAFFFLMWILKLDCERVGWIKLAEDRDQWGLSLKPSGFIKGREFLSS